MARLWTVAVILLVSLADKTLILGESCFESRPPQEIASTNNTDCVQFHNTGFLICSESCRGSNVTVLGVAFVREQLGDFRLVRGDDVPECESFFVLTTSMISSWLNSVNPEEVVAQLDTICFTKQKFAVESEKTFPYRILFKIEKESDEITYSIRKVALVTPSGGEYRHFNRTTELEGLCTTCQASGARFGELSLSRSANLTQLLELITAET